MNQSQILLLSGSELEQQFIVSAIDLAGILVMGLDDAGCIRQANQPCLNMMGYGLDEVIGKPMWDFLVQPDEIAFVKNSFEEFRHDFPKDFVFHWRTKSGEIRVLTWANNVAQKTPFLLACVGRDVTEKHWAETVMTQEGVQPRLVLEQIPAVIWTVNERFEITNSYGAALDALGYKSGQLENVSLKSYFQTNSSSHTMLDLHRRALKGERIRFESESNGRVFETIMEPLRDGCGNVKGVACIAVDITERKQLERLLERKHEELRTIFDSTPAFIWYKDRNNVILGANKQAALSIGLTAAEVEGRSTYELFPIDAEKYHLDDLDVINSGQSKLNIVERFIVPSGENRWMRTDKIPYRDSDGNINGVIVFAIDITAQKMAEETLEELAIKEKSARLEAERLCNLRDEFLVTLSHELRSPLAPIIGWTNLLIADCTEQSKILKPLRVIQRNAKVELQLIEDLLDTSRIVTGKLILEVGKIDICQVIHDSIEIIKHAAESKQIAISLDLDTSEKELLGDPKRLRQIFWNILSNAVKFTQAKGHISVCLRYEETAAVVSIGDDGIGISADFLPHVFERFRQADSSTTRKYGGLGLGLALVHHIVDAHGGKVVAESSGVGKGSQFIISLPYPDATMNLSAVTSAIHTSNSIQNFSESARSLKLAGMRVLIVDDVHDDRTLISNVLCQHTAEVRAVSSVKEALALIPTWRPNVIVSDIAMPEDDGFSFIRALRNADNTQANKIPFIALTGYAESGNRQRVLEAGFQSFLAKPADPNLLVDEVFGVLHNKQT